VFRLILENKNLRLMQQLGYQVPGVPSSLNRQQGQINQVHEMLNEDKKDEYGIVLERFQKTISTHFNN